MTRPLELKAGEIRKALGDPDTPGLVLLTIAIYEIGDGVMGNEEAGIRPYDSAEIWSDLHSKYGTWVTEDGENKLNAIITGLNGGLFWRDIDVFMAVSTALFDGDLGDLLDVGFEDLSATELMWSILEMGLAWDSDDTPEFSLDINQYVNGILAYEQEDQNANANEVERAYLMMLEQLKSLGIPTSMIREWDEEYAEIAGDLADGSV